MKTTIFVAIAIAAFGAVGVTTSIVSSGIPVHAQLPPPGGGGCNAPTICTNGQQPPGSLVTSGRTTATVGGGPISASGHADGSGGGSVSAIPCGGESGPGCQPTLTKCVGSPGFQATIVATFQGTECPVTH